ncbi:lactoylglutathione lyase [Candidatus Parcubacteria bacterium]|nr:MAG: lactoylglutathione lyase [Candidatus Parcubacteria bacterium]
MRYLHTMIRIGNIEEALNFYCGLLGMKEVRRSENEKGRYTNIFLAADGDEQMAKETKTPILELTYNWPDDTGKTEEYTGGRNFGHLAYEVENIYDTCTRLQEKGVVINRPPRDGNMAFIRSPDGISIELLQKGEPLATAEPWTSMPNTGTW